MTAVEIKNHRHTNKQVVRKHHTWQSTVHSSDAVTKERGIYCIS